MSETQRQRLGIVGVVAGVALLAFGVLMAHFTGLSETNALGEEIYPHVPRCLPFEPIVSDTSCWLLPTTGQLIGLVGSQVLLVGVLVGWVLWRPLTWSRAAVAALITTVQAIVWFGVVPNQWLALSQGTFEWTSQKIAFTLPAWLMLNNEVSISYGVIKDLISAGYSTVLLVAVLVGAYQVQERARRAARPEPEVLSAYGRPLVRGD